MQFRASSWNVNNRDFRDTHAELLRRVDTDLLALQEVSPDFHKALDSSGLFDWSAFSLSFRPPQHEEGRSRRLGCAIFGRSPFQFCSAELLEELPFPERALIVKINSGVDLRMCSFHIPPGASWGKIKPQTLRAIAEWLTKQSGYTIFGIDANTPKTDHPVFEQNQWWWKGRARFAWTLAAVRATRLSSTVFRTAAAGVGGNRESDAHWSSCDFSHTRKPPKDD
jgi:exonuclease III